jgi:hypothetical protein
MTDQHEHISAQKARSGEISGRVRNVLIISTALAVLALAVIAAYWMG